MGVMIKWLDKKLEVNPDRVCPAEDLSYSRGLQADNTTDSEGKSTKNLRGYDPRKFSCSFRLTMTLGFPDIIGEYESWEALIGMYAPLYVGSVQLCDKPFMLKDTALSDVTQDIVTGKIFSAVIKLEFEERVDNKSKDKGSATNINLSTALGISTQAAQKNTAVSIRANSYDKSLRK